MNFCLIDTAAIIGSNYPLWAISGTFAPQKVCPLYPQWRTFGSKNKVRFVPIADMDRRLGNARSLPARFLFYARVIFFLFRRPYRTTADSGLEVLFMLGAKKARLLPADHARSAPACHCAADDDPGNSDLFAGRRAIRVQSAMDGFPYHPFHDRHSVGSAHIGRAGKDSSERQRTSSHFLLCSFWPLPLAQNFQYCRDIAAMGKLSTWLSAD